MQAVPDDNDRNAADTVPVVVVDNERPMAAVDIEPLVDVRIELERIGAELLVADNSVAQLVDMVN